MKRFAGLLALAATIALFASCDNGGGFLSASGTNNEMMVLMDDTAWEGTAGRALFDVLNSNAKALPQPEPNFTILQIEPEDFSSTFKMARNIIIPEISSIYSTSKLTADIDKYAVGQVIMTIHAPDSTSFAKFVTDNRESIVDYFVTKELERTGKWLQREVTSP
ncbi:MAG: DUF4837 family protein, partial [Proteiniphilum sp.]|nr:DUF4837 family protein [Proteiniphilum sp.]